MGSRGRAGSQRAGRTDGRSSGGRDQPPGEAHPPHSAVGLRPTGAGGEPTVRRLRSARDQRPRPGERPDQELQRGRDQPHRRGLGSGRDRRGDPGRRRRLLRHHDPQPRAAQGRPSPAWSPSPPTAPGRRRCRSRSRARCSEAAVDATGRQSSAGCAEPAISFQLSASRAGQVGVPGLGASGLRSLQSCHGVQLCMAS